MRARFSRMTDDLRTIRASPSLWWDGSANVSTITTGWAKVVSMGEWCTSHTPPTHSRFKCAGERRVVPGEGEGDHRCTMLGTHDLEAGATRAVSLDQLAVDDHHIAARSKSALQYLVEAHVVSLPRRQPLITRTNGRSTACVRVGAHQQATAASVRDPPN